MGIPARDTEFVIRPAGAFETLGFSEFWPYRYLLGLLVWRELALRYRQTLVGVGWVITRPLVTAALFTFVFNKVAGISAPGVPYPIFVYAGLLFWQTFADGVTNAAGSFVSNPSLIQKTYFPRLILPTAAVVATAADFAVSLGVFLALAAWYHVPISPVGLALVPLALVLTMGAALGLGAFLAALNVRYRDVRYALPFLIQSMLYLTPVMYPPDLLKAKPAVWHAMIVVNPVAGVIAFTRDGLLKGARIEWWTCLESGIGVLVFVALGAIYLRSSQSRFADVI